MAKKIGDLTQEELDTLMATLEAKTKIADKVDSALASVTAAETKVKELETKLSSGERAEKELFTIKLNNRVGEVSKWLENKGKDKEKLITQIANMDEDSFDLFKEGKTNNEYKTATELQTKEEELKNKELTLEQAKTDAVKAATKELEDKTKKTGDAPLIPPTETGDDDGAKDKKKLANGLPSIDAVKDMYGLNDNAMYHNVQGFEKRTENYIKKTYNNDEK